MTATVKQRPSGQLTLQGQTVPAEAINPDVFFNATRRKRNQEYKSAYNGLGGGDVIELRKSDILSDIFVRFSGALTVVHGTGNVNATLRWPYDLVRAFRFTAQGVSNLHNYSGLKAKAREMMKNPDATDRGVSQPVGSGTAVQGTLALASESWGVGPGQTAIASGTYNVELEWRIAVAEDDKDLAGAIFMQTSASDMTLNIDYATAAQLFTVTGNDTVALAGTIIVETIKFSIPVVGGQFVIPDLSVFHSVIQTNTLTLQQGDNEIPLIGAGTGKTLLRVWYQVWQGAAPATPLIPIGGNFGVQGWRYGSNETPEMYSDGRSMRQFNETLYASDLGAVWGILCHEFDATWAFRDAVDLGQVSALRLLINLVNAPTSPNLEYVQETVYAAGAAA